MKTLINLIVILISISSCNPSSDNSLCSDKISSRNLTHNWDSDRVFTSFHKDLNRDILGLTNKNLSGVFYNNEIGQITRKLNFNTCLADIWDGGYIRAVAFTDTSHFAFLLNKYYCDTIENWLCYGDCSKLLDDKKITQTIVGKNGVTMIRRKTSR